MYKKEYLNQLKNREIAKKSYDIYIENVFGEKGAPKKRRLSDREWLMKLNTRSKYQFEEYTGTDVFNVRSTQLLTEEADKLNLNQLLYE